MKTQLISMSAALFLSLQLNANSPQSKTPQQPLRATETTMREIGGQRLDLHFEDGSLLSGEIRKEGAGSYVYTAELVRGGSPIGTYHLYFQTRDSGSGEVVIFDSMHAEYSNADLEIDMTTAKGNVLKTKHETAKNSIGNIR